MDEAKLFLSIGEILADVKHIKAAIITIDEKVDAISIDGTARSRSNTHRLDDFRKELDTLKERPPPTPPDAIKSTRRSVRNIELKIPLVGAGSAIGGGGVVYAFSQLMEFISR